MSKPDYSAFDAELLKQIGEGQATFNQLVSVSALNALAAPLIWRGHGRFPVPEWRIVDRRLQALRKAGKIRFDGKKWAFVEKGGAE